MKTNMGFDLIQKGLMVGLLGSLFTSNVYANPQGYVLNVELAPAICKTDASQKRTRQCLEGYSLSVAGLYPVGVNKSCETNTTLALTPVQKRVLMRIMPDENIQVRLWRQVGGCVGMNANQYFRLMVNYAERLNMPEEFSTPTNLRVNRQWLEKRFIQQNVNLSSASFQFQCSRLDRTASVLTNIQVCYQSNGKYIGCKVEASKQCPDQFLIQGSY